MKKFIVFIKIPLLFGKHIVLTRREVEISAKDHHDAQLVVIQKFEQINIRIKVIRSLLCPMETCNSE
jgi:hypothetical protein